MKKGFTLIELMIVISIIGVIISIAIPGFMRARRVAQARACQANLRNISGAIAQWAMENRAQRGTEITWDDLLEPPASIPDPYLRSLPSCPAGGEYIINETGLPPFCTSGEAGHNIQSARLPISEWTIEEPPEGN